MSPSVKQPIPSNQLENGRAGGAREAGSAARQQPGAARGRRAAERGRKAERAQVGAHPPAQRADAAEQAQAGADVDQEGRFLGLRHQRRVLQQRHRDRMQGFGLARGRALVHARLGLKHQHAAAPHADLHPGGARRGRRGQHALLLEHYAAGVTSSDTAGVTAPVRAEDLER
jgi:hypothetical protein